jgi:hypothetical protein
LTTQNGIYVKTGATTRRYLGTFYTTSTTTTEDSSTKRHLWNYYNRRPTYAFCGDPTNNWTYTTATWRAANNNTTVGEGRVECVIGIADKWTYIRTHASCANTTPAVVSSGVGIDSTSVNSSQMMGQANLRDYGVADGNCASVLAAGFHYLQMLEISQAVGTTTWYGDSNVSYFQAGLFAELEK